MPIVTVEWYEGRSAQQKAEIAQRLTDALVEVGDAAREQISIRFVDSARSDWAIGGEIQAEGEALGPPD